MSDFTDVFSRAKKTVIRKTDELTKIAKLSMEIEGCKSRISAIYEKIGECIVNDTDALGKLDDDKIIKLVVKAKAEKAKLCELVAKKSELSDKALCENCGKSVKKSAFCPSCGEKMK